MPSWLAQYEHIHAQPVPAPTWNVTQLFGPVVETRLPLWWRLRQSALTVEGDVKRVASERAAMKKARIV